MKSKPICLLFIFLCILLLLSGCTEKSTSEDESYHVVATSYPVYIFAMNVMDGSQNLQLDLLVDQQISCIHDYTLSVKDMMRLEKADLLLLNGAGLETFLNDALKNYSDLPICDCSRGIDTITLDDGSQDPHIWLNPLNAVKMTENLTSTLCEMFPEQASLFRENCSDYTSRLTSLYDELLADMGELNPEIITFHDGFNYFASAFNINILHSIEEEAGSEASAAEINEIIDEIKTHPLAVIFTETNGSDSTAKSITSETGTAMGVLNTAVSGEKTLTGYEDILRYDVETVINTVNSRIQ